MLPGQLDLLAWTSPRSRRRDPATSHESANHAAKFAGKHCADIVATLRAAGRAMACEEIADALGWASHVTANRRMSECVDAGLIARTEERHTNRSGRQAFKYRAVP